MVPKHSGRKVGCHVPGHLEYKGAFIAAPPVSGAETALAEAAHSGSTHSGSALGSLIDTDLAKESAQLMELQNRQRLDGDSQSNTNRAPQTLLSLFGHP